MDPRKTVRIADFERAIRESRPIIIARPVIAVGKPARAESLTQTLVWGSGEDPQIRSPFGERTTLNDLKAASAPSLADQLEARVHEVTRPRTKVELETQEVQRLAAEVWASQAAVGLETMARTIRDQPLDRVTIPQVDPVVEPALAPLPEAALDSESRPGLSTDALSPIGQIFRRLRLSPPSDPMRQSDVRPRRRELPGLTRGLRIACGALCAVCVAITWLSISGVLDAGRPEAPAAKPAPATAPPSAPAAPTAAPEPAAASGHETEAAYRPASQPALGTAVTVGQAPQPAAAPSRVSPRAAVDALMAGKHEVALARYRALAQSDPGNPAYAAAVQILAETEPAEQEGL